MAYLNTRADFIAYIQRKLGSPAVKINVTAEQFDDIVDEALTYYQQYHFDATERIIVSHQVTQTDIDNGYLTTIQDTIGIDNVWYQTASNITNGWHGIYAKEMWDKLRASTDVGSGIAVLLNTEYNIDQFKSLLEQKVNWQYNRHSNKLRLQIDWSLVQVDEYIIYEAIRVVNPDTNPDVWNDIWLKKYAVELSRKQWGTNLDKFQNVTLPGGMTIDGASMIQQADDAIEVMEQEMLSKYSFGSQIYLM